MKKLLSLICIGLITATACNDRAFLDVQPRSILDNDQAFSEPNQVLSILADLYNRQLDISTLKDWVTFADFSESFPSENGRVEIVQRNSWGFGAWGTWDYGYVRDLNLFIERATAAKALTDVQKTRFLAEARFLRAAYYFEMAKRMGGVPLILQSLVYELGSDPGKLQYPRSKEAEIYDFVIKEAEAIKNDLPADVNQKSRATKAAALAMEARAALYAGSIARYGVNTPQVSLPGEEVGIPAAKANGYYTQALTAAREIINGNAGSYALYMKKNELSENFANIFIDKANNPESIFVEDFKLKSGKVHNFTVVNQPRYGAEEEEGGRINPSLNLLLAFEKLDNTFAPLSITDGGGQPVFYNQQIDIFAGRDARLAGTIMLPGSIFRERAVDIWAGYQLADGSILTGDDRGAQKKLPGTNTNVQVVGFDGPVPGKEFTAQTGFYLRKYLDPAPGAGSRGTNSELPFIRYRYAEVLLNAAEAAFELGQKDVAASYMNQVRARAGLINPLNAADITFDRIVHERRVELAFEGHIFYDMKRWRLAHIVWDGNKLSTSDLLTNLGKAAKRSTQPYGLWAYKLYNPASPNNGKWLYKIVLPQAVTGANRFQLGNYYSFIDDNIRANNPKIVRQPNQ
ncbi:RagB/SusD family nutrient uptake outer membrane protein [Chitinophaga pendula]|uniref:RagB/SusD family nutrient uptake outer membrane protein n=1 Tax=Chitinophaga TaxID=79328 RepID=UPI000BAF8571|nr:MULTISPECIES: RagB/SusD family nutrient uptake outer membrane protein [Chitinophaga]ASZ15056.1 RagB/SusD family nutrient uptake outer membrane protein [Chitinophaga sp. MD30]UCJ08939.1 RagB/SusD family nutrient uptake outer membrane protein [Chitinophaga pendula]